MLLPGMRVPGVGRAQGCKQLFIGLESISQTSVNEAQKRFNRVSNYGRAIERIHSHGIAVQAGIAIGRARSFLSR